MPLTREKPGFVPRRPALAAVVCLIAGILVGSAAAARPANYLAIAISASIGAILCRRRSILCSSLIALALFTLGAALEQREFYRYRPDEIAAFSSAQPRLVQLELRIDEPPRQINSSVGGRELPPKQQFTASVLKILTTSGWADASGLTLVKINRVHPLLAAGQIVRVLGLLDRPAHATNPGEFDWADFYRQRRILTSVKVSRVANVSIINDNGPGFFGWLQARTRDFLAMGFTSKKAADHALLQALVLGDIDPSVRDSQQQFQQIGAAYLLSISGMHIALVCALVYFSCRLLLKSPRSACALCLTTVILYGIVVLSSESAFRAVLLCVGMLIGIWWRRDIDKLQLLSLVAGVLLIQNPLEIFSAGFQLGFVCLLGLILLGRPLLHYLARHDHTDKGPPSFRWRTWIVLRTWLAISFIAWITSIPIVAYQFGQFSPWSIAAGTILFPMVAVALLGGCAKILLTLAWPSLSQICANLTIAPVIAIRHAAVMLSHLPHAAIATEKPLITSIIVYYALLLLPVLPWRWLIVRRVSIATAIVSVLCMIASLCFGFPRSAVASEDGISITFLDIGAGQCAVLQIPGQPAALIDAGSTTVSDVVRTSLGPFLDERHVNVIGDVLLSHSDYDHISAIPAAAARFGLRTVYTSPYFAHFASIDPPAQAMLDLLGRMNRSPHLIQRGDHLQLASDVGVDVLWPPRDCTFNCNNTGLVLRLTYHNKTILLPADIQVDAMREMLASPSELKADVLIAPHHGSSEVTTPAFVNAVDPAIIISSNSAPLTEKQKRFEKMIGHRPLYRTSSCGAITLHVHADGSLSVETFLH